VSVVGPRFTDEVVRDWRAESEGDSMAIKITVNRRDDRVERILRDPKSYFAQARRQARAEVKREMAREQKRARRGPATA
jgi:hypothetical protein